MPFFNSHLGLESDGEGGIRLETLPEHQVAPDVIHFAVLTTMAEVAAAGVVGAPVVPTVVSVNLMARATPGTLRAQGSLLRRGRTLAVAEGLVHQGDRLVAKATVTFAVLGG